MAGGDDVRHISAGQTGDAVRFGEMHIEKTAVPAGNAAERMERLDDSGPLCPAAADAGGECRHGGLAAGNRFHSQPPHGFIGNGSPIEAGHILIVHIFNHTRGGQPVLRQSNPPAVQIGADLFVLHLVEAEFGKRRPQLSQVRPAAAFAGKQPVEEGVNHAGELWLGAAGLAKGVEFGAPRRGEFAPIGLEQLRNGQDVVACRHDGL